MANLTPVPSWDAVPQIEITTPVLGGAGQPANWQAQALLNRQQALVGDLASTATGKGAALVALAGGGTALDLRDGAPVISALDKRWGVVGDGTTDDTTAFNQVLAYASANGWAVSIPAKAVVRITGFAYITNGCRGVFGPGTIKCDTAAGSQSGLVLKGKQSGAASNVYDCTVEGLTIDCNNKPGVIAIWLQGSSRCIVRGNVIKNGYDGYGVVLNCNASTSENPEGNVIAGNSISGAITTDPNATTYEWFGIGVNAEAVFTAPYTSADTQWKALKTPPGFAVTPIGNTITGNTTLGGYYGIMCSGGCYNSFTGNRTKGTIRGIIIANSAVGNMVVGNLFTEMKSAGVHVSYGSSNNTIQSNTVYTTVNANGEALLQAYVGTKNNRFIGNACYSVDGTGAQYGAYTAIHADGNVFSGNSFYGYFSRAVIGVESAWDSAETNPASYAYNKGTPGGANFNENFASTGMANVAVENNDIFCLSSVPAIYLGQITGTYTVGTWPLSDVVVRGNAVRYGSHNYQIDAYERTANNLTNCVLESNSFYRGASVSNFRFSQGRAHFAVCADNSIIDNHPSSAPWYTLTVNSSTPDVSKGRFWQCSQTGATNVTSFSGGHDGMEITVRCDNLTTFVHNSSYLRLKGGANIVGASSDSLVVFRRFSGIWFEKSRNF